MGTPARLCTPMAHSTGCARSLGVQLGTAFRPVRHSGWAPGGQ